MAVIQSVGTEPRISSIPVRTISSADLRASLKEAIDDFNDKRGDLLFAGMLYPLIGLFTALVLLNSDSIPLLFPLIAGLSLLGPLVSTGFYELARRREEGLESTWAHFFDVVKRPAIEQITWVGGLMIILFVGWIAAAGLIYSAFLGPEPPASLGAFLTELFTTPEGWAMMIVGNLVGLLFAAFVLAVSVVSLPMLVDCDVDAGVAIRTSIAAVRKNLFVMGQWGFTVVALLLIGTIPLFLGLAVVLPILGYATWHLYTKVVERDKIPADCP